MKSSVGVFVTVRVGSSRLCLKHLYPVQCKPILLYLINRLKQEIPSRNIILCTTKENNDRVLCEFAKQCDILYFCGNSTNILKRHWECARFFKKNIIVNVDGDDVFCDPLYVKMVIKELIQNKVVDVVKTEGLPFGMNSFGYKFRNFKKLKNVLGYKNFDTGWGIVVTDEKLFDIKILHPNHSIEFDEKLRFTLDYYSDYQFLKNIIENTFKKNYFPKLNEIIEYVNKNHNKNLFKHVKSNNQKYWECLYSKMQKQLEDGENETNN